MSIPSRVTVSLSGAAGAHCSGPSGGSPVLVISDDLVSLRIDVSAMDARAAVMLAGGLASAVNEFSAALDGGDVSASTVIPPPPYAAMWWDGGGSNE